MNRKLINVVKGDINTALENGNYNRNTTYQTNIEFNTPTKLILLDGIPYSSPLLTQVTWQELKNKRDASKLTPGALYRITDYNCTTTQENTKSAGHQFDIVLLALSKNKLAEEGWAMMHDGDEYFQNSKLEAWKIWYCLDNDKSRFAWADDSVDEGSPANIECTIFDWDAASNVERWYRNPSSDVDNKYYWIGEGSTIEIYTDSENPTVGASVYNNKYGEIGTVSLFNPSQEGTNLPNGRGVIYRLIDEFNNDLPCDFKNILVILKAVESYLITADDVHQDYSMLGKIRGITVSLCLHTDGHGNNKNAVPIGRIAPSSRTGLYNIKISSSALEGAGLLDISSNTIVGYTI